MKDRKKHFSPLFTFCRKTYLSLFIVLFLTGHNYSALGKELPAEQEKILEALSVYINMLTEKQASVDEIFDKVDVDVSTITEVSHIKERKSILKEFINANAELMETRRNGEAILTEELEKRGVSRKNIDAYIKGYRDGQKEEHSLLLKIDVTNTQSMETWLNIMDLLESEWGNWQPDPSTYSIQTDDDNLIEKFNNLIERNESIADEQAKYIKEFESQ